MPDIMMCDNQICQKRSECYRAQGLPSYMQSWCIFNEHASPDSKCDYFVQIVRHKQNPDLVGYSRF